MCTTLSIISMDQGRGIYVPDRVPTEDFVPPPPGHDVATPARFRMIWVTAAVVVLYCVLVPFAPAILSWMA